MKKTLFYISLILLFSCKKEIAINVEDKEAQLVVNAELRTDSLVSFRLSLSQNITDNGAKPAVTDAVVETMRDDSSILDFLSHTGQGIYRSAWMKPIAGTRYLFRIRQGGNEYWVNERIPDSLMTGNPDTARLIFQGKKNFFQFRIKITDESTQDNFYGLKLKRIYESYAGTDTIQEEEWVNIESVDFILTENHESRFSKKQILFTDAFFKGLVQEFKFGCGGLFEGGGQKTRALLLYVSSYSESGYRYYTSVNEHLLYQNDPFSQATLIRGNVVSALGAAVGEFTKVYHITLE